MKRDWRTAILDSRQRAMCEFAEKLALSSSGTTREEIDSLRTAGLDDRAILDLVQLVAYYAYVNRIADALGVELEPSRGGPPINPRKSSPDS